MTDVSNKVALVTGAASGLGAATVKKLVACGAKVFATGRNQLGLEETCSINPENIVPYQLDVSQPENCKEAVSACVEQFGQLDVLINIAGKHEFRHSTEVTPEQWQEDLAVNVSGPFFLCQAAIPHLLKAQGNIVNVASIAGLQGQPYSAGYCSAKHALIGLTRSLALEYMKTDMRVNAVCPGGMDTPQLNNINFPNEVDFDLVMRTAGLRGTMDADEVANVIVFLASDEASAIHGAIHTVDRGKTVG